ncbi:uncharacterized protein BXIN_1690 [Babesia sp. Xinjiang]|uniref:uncharacterized protein n=1 Tax=Babesia sp. Xinjiang TaxID=462227 RepID=UPI000A23FD5A|nr:uncharacterized protein BXIN_1730 [Babesia sp. Xinjiang]XP_028871414.1 uncharacterized protein BXIN_1690 [Babesia sp. Xinjiang]ORM40892.1 hypothetical protein BXIN_1730 [Babesia sp. Xinjiang]ORM40958.1 hypothetical protein BXIN_1690 [Babesia sp. Xinjiang]
MTPVGGIDRNHSGPTRKKQVARDSLCALLCDDASLQKSAALTLSRASATDNVSLEVLLSLVRGEPPNCMPSFSISKSIFLPKDSWIESTKKLPAADTEIGVNTLRECLQGPEAWERARVVALKALLVTYNNEKRQVDDILPHVLVGLKADSEKKLSYSKEVSLALAIAFAEAIPDSDSFEYAVLKMSLVNEDIKIPVLRAIIVRALGELTLLPRLSHLLHRMLDCDSSTPVFDELLYAPRMPKLAAFAIVHFCCLNRQCLENAVPYALQVIDWHAGDRSDLRLLFLVALAVRLEGIDTTKGIRGCINFMQTKLESNINGGYADDFADAIRTRPNVIRVIVDALVTTGFRANRDVKPLYELVKLLKTIMDLMVPATLAAAADNTLTTSIMDVASLLKVRALAVHLTNCGIAIENDRRLENLLETLTVALSNKRIEEYVSKFDSCEPFVLHESHIWDDIAALSRDYMDIGLCKALQSRIKSATDIVWAFNTLQRLYVGIVILGNTDLMTSLPDLHGNVLLLKEKFCIRDALNVALAILTMNLSLHSSAHAYIDSMAARSTEQALFFVSSLLESTLLIIGRLKLCPKVGFELLDMNLVIFARLSRHRLSLPIIFTALKHIFGHPESKRAQDAVEGFHQFEARWRCLLLRDSDVPTGKIAAIPNANRMQAMSQQEKEVYMKVFRALCKYRPEDALKHVNENGILFYDYPVDAVESCLRMCKNDVMDFGVAYRVYVGPIFNDNCTNLAVVSAVGRFFCEYLESLIKDIQGQITEEDIVDLNLILPMLLRVTALKDANGAVAIAKLMKSPLWAKLDELRKWHLNRECDCYSLLDRISKKRLTCTYAKIDPTIFEFEYSAFICADTDEDIKDKDYMHGQSLLISSLLDAESSDTSRAELLSRRNERVLNFNREIRRATRELLQILGNSKPTVSSFRWFLEDDESEQKVPRVSPTMLASVFPIHSAESGLGCVRLFHITALFHLYGKRISGRKFNSDVIFDNAFGNVSAVGTAIGGIFLVNVALLVNATNKRSVELADHMLQYLKDMCDSIESFKGTLNTLRCERGIVYALALSYMYIQNCVNTDFPRVVLGLLRSALLKFEACKELAEALFFVIGSIYRYTNLHFNLTENIINLFTEYLDVNHERPVGLGWMIGLMSFVADIPRASIGLLSALIDRMVTMIESQDSPLAQRARLCLPLLQYCGINRYDKIATSVARVLIQIQGIAANDPNTLLLHAYCHFMGFEPSLVSHSCVSPDSSNTKGDLDNEGDGTSTIATGKESNTATGISKGCNLHGCDTINNNPGQHHDVEPNTDVTTSSSTDELTEKTAKLHEAIMASIKANVAGNNEVRDLLLFASLLAHGYAYMVPANTACWKRMLDNKVGWSSLYKNLTTALSAIARQEAVKVTMAAGPRVSRYSRARGPAAPPIAAASSTVDGLNSWGDESAVLVAIFVLETIKGFLAKHSDLDCYREDGIINHMVGTLRENRHSVKLLNALTLCKPLKLTLWDVVSYDDTRCDCEREMVTRLYCLHGSTNRLLLERLVDIAKHFTTFDSHMKLSFLNCLRLSVWNIDFNSLRAILSYIVGLDDIDVLLTIETLIESCAYLMKGSDGAVPNGEKFASDVLLKLLHPVTIQVLSRSRHDKAAICLYRKLFRQLTDERRVDLRQAINKSDIAVKSLLSGVCANGEAPFTFNECFAHLVTQRIVMKDVVLYCYVNIHRQMEVILHCIHVLNVNANTEQITLVLLALMALVAERNVASYLLELLFDGNKISATERSEVPHVATLGTFEFLRFNREANILYYDTIDEATLSKSANMTAPAPGMWKDCGLESTALGKLLPMAHGRCVPSWLPKLGDVALDRRRQSMLPISLPPRQFAVNVSDEGARHLLVENAMVIMASYKAFLLDSPLEQPGLHDVMTFLNSRLV